MDYEFTDDWYCDSKICEHYLIKDCLYHRNKELQQRIEKAIEFTTLRFNEDNHLSCGSVARLLSILKGEDKK